ncbi:MAG: hypothetical protein ACFKPT_02015 [Gloeotrichia echinulata GP01]
MKAVFHRPIEGKLKTVTISKTPTDKYLASILCEVDGDVSQSSGNKILGIDLGLKDFAIDTFVGAQGLAPLRNLSVAFFFQSNVYYSKR